ncbi:SMP-30/gluconolactonase/LRE family protein [Devosia sp. A16]|uniref:SMP-30/gluconolactonase/LRE family protein n=1 Tax=Devosia sp. A16 TaxID=1736675 RepID=UPI0009E6FCC5|nr:SMP-30/gluconolactonase/LRE family protein [Devosia sp. A16]
MRALLMGGLALAAMASAAVAADKVQIGDKNVFPESITSTADGTLIAGSIGTGEIFRAAPGTATAGSWIAAQTDGPTAVLGVFADEANGTLWACYSDLAMFGGAGGKPSVLRSFDLATGAVKASIPLGEGTFCNDIATTADGTAYAADTAGGQLFRVKPGADTAEPFFKDAALASLDGLSFGPDGALYLNGVQTNKLFRLAMNADGTPGALTELTLSQPIKGPDGMRFGEDGVLYLAENGAAQVSAVTFEGDNAIVKVVEAGGWDMPTAVTKVGDTLWVLEAKLSKLGGTEDPGAFWAYPLTLQ